MRKVIKILAKVLSTIILLSIFLPIGITLLLSVDSIQNFVVDKAADFASDRLGTRVSIDRIDLDLFSKVRVRGFYVEDYEQDTLLYVGDVRARLAEYDFRNKSLYLEGGEVSNGKLCIREMQSGELNIRPIVRRLVDKDGKGEFKLFISDIKADNIEFSYERLEHRNPVYGVDYNDMLIRNICGVVRDFSVIKGVVVCDVEGISAREKSGFELASFTSGLRVDKGVIEFTEVDAATKRSTVSMPRMLIDGRHWDQYKFYIDSVDMHGEVSHAVVDSRDVAYFAPGLRDWSVVVADVNGTFDGYVRDFKVHLNSARLGEGSSVVGDAHMVGMPDWRNADYDIDIERAYILAKDANAVVDSIRKGGLPKQARNIVKRVGWVDLAGTFVGNLEDFDVDGKMSSGVGRVVADVDITRSEDFAISGKVTTRGLNVGRVVNHSPLQEVDAHIEGRATLGNRNSAELDVAVKGLRYGSYRYEGISLVGEVDGGEYSVEMVSEDENLNFDLMGAMNLDLEQPTYSLALDLRRADLHAIGLNKRDTTSVLSLKMGLEAMGSSVDNLVGRISIADAVYQYPDNVLETDRLQLSMYGDNDLRAAMLESEFVNLQYQSYLSYNDAYSYIYNFVMTYIPLLYDDNSEKRELSRTYERDETMLKIEMGDKINELLDAVASSLVVAPDTEAYLAFSPSNNKMMMRGSSEAIEYSGVIMANMAFNIDKKQRDSLSLWLESSCIYLGARPLMPKFNITGGAACRLQWRWWSSLGYVGPRRIV